MKSPGHGIPGGAGTLNQQCTVQRKTNTVSSRGGATEAWVDDFTAYCSATPAKGQEYPKLGARDIVAEKRQGESLMLFVLRFRSGLGRETHRIVYGGRTWNITDIRTMPNGVPVYLEIDATSIT